jgi:hypothetical protein
MNDLVSRIFEVRAVAASSGSAVPSRSAPVAR